MSAVRVRHRPPGLRVCGASDGTPNPSAPARGATPQTAVASNQTADDGKTTANGGRKNPPPSVVGHLSPNKGSGALDRLFEFLGGAEGHLLAGLDLDRFAGCRITPHAGGALAHHQDAEAANADA